MRERLIFMILDSPVMWIVILIALTAILLRAIMWRLQANSSERCSDSEMTGSTVAERILAEEGLYDVPVKCMELKKVDYYNSNERAVYLSHETYYGSSIYALASAAHQCGHAKQHKEDYCSMYVRSIVVTVLSIVSFFGLLLMVYGMINHFNPNAIQAASVMMVSAIVFQFFSLPVEFNASGRALYNLTKQGLIPEYEKEYCRQALRAVALTYLASSALAAGIAMRIASRR